MDRHPTKLCCVWQLYNGASENQVKQINNIDKNTVWNYQVPLLLLEGKPQNILLWSKNTDIDIINVHATRHFYVIKSC